MLSFCWAIAVILHSIFPVHGTHLDAALVILLVLLCTRGKTTNDCLSSSSLSSFAAQRSVVVSDVSWSVQAYVLLTPHPNPAFWLADLSPAGKDTLSFADVKKGYASACLSVWECRWGKEWQVGTFCSGGMGGFPC